MHAIIFKRVNHAKLKVLAEQTPAAAHRQINNVFSKSVL
jgi:hypothetical protein